MRFFVLFLCVFFFFVGGVVVGFVVHSDDTAPGDPCPFETLRSWCDEATHDGGLATIACDDGGGTEQACSDDDYSYGLVRLALIARGNLLFADSHGGFPWRVLYVVR